ncbi:hypothetical protein BDEG_23905 [Batrachochytrium dendrobatidis JEL423]|uniref:Rab3 GTPase-activating protein catalytic subunit n=2 Tax=Batrachochytrium dendrobatidis (strain JEL423) TaxID=403673 RepID=A0A177WL01_BATDL|nr:hypothetical protein BDEG_23905 [Batrachochytrium dendrobatidis JEL423]
MSLPDNPTSQVEEVFEIIDYTSASTFERLVVSIESILTKWGVDQGRLGVLDSVGTAAITCNSTGRSTSKTTTHGIGMPSLDSSIPNQDSLKSHIRYKTIVFEEQTYTISYHSLPTPIASSFLETSSDIKHFQDQQPQCSLPESISEYFPVIHSMAEFLTYPGYTSSSSRGFDASRITAAARNLAGGATNAGSTSTTSILEHHSLLHRWTSLTHFLVFSGVQTFQNRWSPDAIYNGIDEDDTEFTSARSGMVDINTSKLFSSAFSLALSNIMCTLPVFIQTGQTWKRVYQGLVVSTCHSGSSIPGFESMGMREAVQRYRMSVLPYSPPAYATLLSICNIFKDRFDLNHSDIPSADINKYIFASIATRYVYEFNSIEAADFKQLPQEFQVAGVFTPLVMDIPSPILRLTLETYYPVAPINSYIGVSIDPTLSPNWNLSIANVSDPKCSYLSNMLKSVIAGWLDAMPDNPSIHAISTDHMLLPGGFYNGSGLSNIRSLDNPRQRLVDHHDVMDTVRFMIQTAEVVPRFQRNTHATTPYMTPSSLLQTSATTDIPSTFTFSPSNTPISDRMLMRSTNQLISQLQYQSATVPMNSPLWLMGVRLLDACLLRPKHLRYDAGILALLKGVWEEFINELSQLWDLNAFIPGVDICVADDNGQTSGKKVDVDMRYTLMHQKLAMLNCCMFRKTGMYPSAETIALQKETHKNKAEDKLDAGSIKVNTGSLKSTIAQQFIPTRLFGTLTDMAMATVGDSVDTISKVISKSSHSHIHSSQAMPAADMMAGKGNVGFESNYVAHGNKQDTQPSVASKTPVVNENVVFESIESTAPQTSNTLSTVMAHTNNEGREQYINKWGNSLPSTALPTEAKLIGPQNDVHNDFSSKMSLNTRRTDAQGSSNSSYCSEMDSLARRSVGHRPPSSYGSSRIGSRETHMMIKPGHSSYMDTLNTSMQTVLTNFEGTSWTSDRSWDRFSVHEQASISTHPQDTLLQSNIPSPVEPRNMFNGASTEPDLMFEPMEGWVDGKTAVTLQRPTRVLTESGADDTNSFMADLNIGQVSAVSNELAGSFVEVKDMRVFQQRNQGNGVLPNTLSTSLPSYADAILDTTRDANVSIKHASDIETIDDDERKGELALLEGMLLIANGQPMWEPQTQESGYMTEDMVREQEQILESLGTSADAAKLRARMQCAQLVSDMEAFKAANPGAMLEDFVRWHSPRDWIEEVGEIGRLSGRMTDSGNLWRECWERARRVPASQQKALFDFEKESAKALHYLESMSLYQILSELMPTFFLIVYDSLSKHPIASAIPFICQSVDKIGQQIATIRWCDIGPDACDSLNEIISEIRQTEVYIYQCVSLLCKLPGQYELVNRLVQSQQADVVGHERDSVFKLFGNDENGSFPFPYAREFILQSVKLPKHTPYSQSSALLKGKGIYARLFALLMDSEFRLVECIQTPRMY